jgi:hypothetical protein
MDKFIRLIQKAIERGVNCSGKDTLENAILNFGSSTDDNKSCVSNIEIVQKSKVVGIGTKSGRFLSDIINAAEGCKIPEQVKSEYPDLTQSEWDAVLRVCTLLLVDLERKI